jgi:hypothetical protein
MARESKRSIWSKRVAAFERSGLSRRAWCAARGLSVSSLDAWHYRLRREGSDGLVPVVVAEAAPPPLIGVSCGAATVRLPSTVDAAWVAALVRGLGAPAC